MKQKTIVLIIVFATLLSCGPKRMKCYGKRCVHTEHKISQKSC